MGTPWPGSTDGSVSWCRYQQIVRTRLWSPATSATRLGQGTRWKLISILRSLPSPLSRASPVSSFSKKSSTFIRKISKKKIKNQEKRRNLIWRRRERGRKQRSKEDPWRKLSPIYGFRSMDLSSRRSKEALLASAPSQLTIRFTIPPSCFDLIEFDVIDLNGLEMIDHWSFLAFRSIGNGWFRGGRRDPTGFSVSLLPRGSRYHVSLYSSWGWAPIRIKSRCKIGFLMEITFTFCKFGYFE